MQRFVLSDWKFKVYNDIDEIRFDLNEQSIFDKCIKEIHTIGMALNLNRKELDRSARRVLFEQGVEFDDVIEAKYADLKHILLELSFNLCEPTVMVFEDNTTLELFMRGKDCLYMSFNQIDAKMVHGSNNPNYNYIRAFKDFRNRKIRDVYCYRSDMPKGSGERKDRTRYYFDMDGDKGFYIENHYDACYNLVIRNISQHRDFLTNRLLVSYDYINKLINPKKHIPIMEGRVSGGTFIIATGSKGNKREVLEDIISIYDNDVTMFLVDFLIDYFDKDFSNSYKEFEMEYTEYFDSNDVNIYSYRSIELLLKDIEEVCTYISYDFNNPRIEKLMDYIKSSYFYFVDTHKKPTAAEREKIIMDNTDVIIDFYKRFIGRVRELMRRNPDGDYVFFTGP